MEGLGVILAYGLWCKWADYLQPLRPQPKANTATRKSKKNQTKKVVRNCSLLEKTVRLALYFFDRIGVFDLSMTNRYSLVGQVGVLDAVRGLLNNAIASAKTAQANTSWTSRI
jgi:hypothetical protein